MTSGGGWAAIGYTLRMAQRVGWWQLWRAMRSRNACKTCALGMGGQTRRHGQRGRPLPRGLQEVAAGDGADMQDGIAPEFFARYSIAAAADAVAARAGMRAAGSSIRSTPARATRTIASIAWDEALDRLVDAAEGEPDPTAASSTPAAGRRTRPASCCSSSPGCTARTTSTTVPTTATRPAASA